MVEGRKRVATGEEHSLEALWAEHVNLTRQTGKLSVDFHRLFGEVHRELRLINACLDRNKIARTTLSATILAMRRGFMTGRERQQESHIHEASNS
ncbi:hypothetical protein KFK09_001308 [Dendrobium nobile]|uniref:Uncharacterized protein n=1 Tax=Dendrobium nobile TaxID=94219 RepID=A0A8T3C4H1_DENNO|nr:hypothetical protein KFK09_001308 [Dendrobium nobile]